jgi:hypothetical protein
LSQKDCSTTPKKNCEVVINDPSFPGCCKVIPKTCTGPNPCSNYSCDPTTGTCKETNLCVLPPEEKCKVSNCSGTACVVTPKCVSSVVAQSCLTVACDPATGFCGSVSAGCDDKDPCTVDKCETNGQCSHTPLCPSTTDKCNPVSCVAGVCEKTVLQCQQSSGCSKAGCDPATGCFNDLDDAGCNNGDICEIGKCNADGTCSFTSFNCSLQNSTFCSPVACVPRIGCVPVALDCRAGTNLTADNESCDIVKCDNVAYQCKTESGACFPLTAILGASIGAGIIAAIICAAILGACLLGGGTYAAATNMVALSEDTVVNNPLYTATQTEFDNPLHCVDV